MTIEELRKKKEEYNFSYETISILTGVSEETVAALFSDDTVKNITYEERRTIEFLLNGPDTDIVRESPVAYAVKAPGDYTVEDYDALPEEGRYELIDGVLYEMSAPNYFHQAISSEISYTLREYVSKNSGKCKVLYAPLDVQLDCDDKTMLQPDIIVVCEKEKFNKRGLFGAPDLVVEILSPSTRKKDMTIKLSKYANAGVCEYWIVDPDKRKIVVYCWEQDVEINIYGFHDNIPVTIFEGKCHVNFETINQEMDSLQNA